jgi:hypothetical protein
MVISNIDVIRQLELIIVHSAFKAKHPKTTWYQISFIIYIVNRVLAGNANQITNKSISERVFGRIADSYDQNKDPIVDIHAGILRRSLFRYYQTAGKNDPIYIELPENTYVPVFKKSPPSQ